MSGSNKVEWLKQENLSILGQGVNVIVCMKKKYGDFLFLHEIFLILIRLIRGSFFLKNYPLSKTR